ncbi:MAG: hypothetical protein L0387_04705, partial [Acidobacteria bacterium]|nr:hypothetical protein [Acidobacteriota bacterium]MCI0620962.1 hypothetical protein [Acidobacteriota bacterium]
GWIPAFAGMTNRGTPGIGSLAAPAQRVFRHALRNDEVRMKKPSRSKDELRMSNTVPVPVIEDDKSKPRQFDLEERTARFGEGVIASAKGSPLRLRHSFVIRA